jgi:hypothetical protein
MALREILAKFGFEVDGKALDTANVKINSVIGNLTNLKGAFTGALAGVGLGFLKGQIDELASESGALNKAAIKAGVGFEQFQRLQYQTGLSTEQLTATFKNLQLGIAAAQGASDSAESSMVDLAEGGLDKIGKKKAGEAIKALGVELTDANGKALSNAEVFGDVAVALSKIQDPSKRAATAQQVFGRSSQDILPLLQKSPEAIAKLGEEFDLFGGITEENRKTLAEYGKEQKRLSLASNALRISILSALTPALTFLFQKFNNGITWIKKNVNTTQLLTAGFAVLTTAVVAFGSASAAAAIRAVAGWAAVALPIIVATLLIDDLIHFFKGDAKTATEDFIVLLFGQEAADSWIAQVRKDLHAFIEDITGAKDKLAELKEFFDFLNKRGAATNAEGGSVDVAVASRGLNRKAVGARGAATRASAEAGIEGGQGTRADIYGPTLEQGGKSLYQPQPTTIAVPAAAKGVNQTIDVKNTTNVVQNITGNDAQDAADQSVEGIKKQAEKDRRATQAALTVRK